MFRKADETVSKSKIVLRQTSGKTGKKLRYFRET